MLALWSWTGNKTHFPADNYNNTPTKVIYYTLRENKQIWLAKSRQIILISDSSRHKFVDILRYDVRASDIHAFSNIMTSIK